MSLSNLTNLGGLYSLFQLRHKMTFGNTELPFGSCDPIELDYINSGISLDEFPSSSNNSNYNSNNNNNFKNIINNNNNDKNLHNDNTLSNLSDTEIDENSINLVNSKYYTVDEFNKLKTSNRFNIFHNNINGLETKFENIHQFLSSAPEFDIIAITETSQKKKNDDFFTNINIEGYANFSTPTNSSKGGTIIYAKSKFDVIERIDLSICDDLYETIWIEIKNKNSKNIICGSIYRHPNDNIQSYNKFLNYLETCLSKLSNENKEVYLCGDFNSDLLKLDKSTNYKKFHDLICSYGFLPQILQPTRIQGDSATIIDNIFTNTSNNKTLSGNILTDLSDHFSQFVSVPRVKIDYKNITMYKRDYTNFSVNSFREDVSIQKFDNNFEE